jgi:hypothetical protein
MQANSYRIDGFRPDCCDAAKARRSAARIGQHRAARAVADILLR